MADLRERLEWVLELLREGSSPRQADVIEEVLAHPEKLMVPVAWRYRYSGLEEWKYVEREALCNPHDCYERTKLYAPEVKP